MPSLRLSHHLLDRAFRSLAGVALVELLSSVVVELAETQRVPNNQTSNSLNQTARATTVVGERSHLSDIPAVTDLDQVHVQHQALVRRGSPRQRGASNRADEGSRMEAHRAKVTLEHIQALDVGVRGSVTLEGLNLRSARTSHTARRGGRQAGRPKQTGEGAFEVGANDAVEAGEVTSLVEHGLEQALHNRVSQAGAQSTSGADDGGRRSAEDGRDVPGSGRASTSVADPSLSASSTVGHRLVASIKLGKLVGGHGDFHVTLDARDRLGDIVRQFVTHTSNISDVLRELGNTDRTAEDLRVVRKFRTIANNIVADTRGEVDIQAVRRTTHLRSGEAVGLPAEVHIPGFGALASHRGERSVLGVNQGNHVHQVFALTAAREVRFK